MICQICVPPDAQAYLTLRFPLSAWFNILLLRDRGVLKLPTRMLNKAATERDLSYEMLIELLSYAPYMTETISISSVLLQATNMVQISVCFPGQMVSHRVSWPSGLNWHSPRLGSIRKMFCWGNETCNAW